MDAFIVRNRPTGKNAWVITSGGRRKGRIVKRDIQSDYAA